MRSAALLAVLAAAPACVTEGPEPTGHRLVAGRRIRSPVFTPDRERHQVMFEVAAGPIDTASERLDLHVVPHAGGEDRLLASNVSFRWGRTWDATGHLYVMHDERPTVPETATLARILFADGSVEELPGVQGLSISARDSRFSYEIAGSPGSTPVHPTLHLREAGGADRVLGPGSAAGFLRERFYYRAAQDDTLTRIPVVGADPEVITTEARRFWLRSDEAVLVMSPTKPTPPAMDPADPTRPAPFPALELFALDLGSRTKLPLPGEGICCPIGYSRDGTRFLYSEAMPPDGPGRLHLAAVATGADQVVDVPVVKNGQTQLVYFTPQGAPSVPADTMILSDAGHRLSLYRPGIDAAAVPLGKEALGFNFIRGGRMAIYIERIATEFLLEGRLLTFDLADPFAPSRVLSPPGANVTGYFRIDDGRLIGMWAHYGEELSDVYLADPETGETSLVAERVGPLAVTPQRMVVVARLSPQDLVGDLVQLDLTTRAERLIARDVEDFALAGACPSCGGLDPGALIAYTVHTRVASRRDGLWAAVLE